VSAAIAQTVAENVAMVRERIARAARGAGRDPAAVRLVAAAKTMPAEAVRQAIAAGVGDIGQNYVQEAISIMAEIEAPVRWHMIGKLQSNKAARVARAFDVVQTVDSLSLAVKLSRRAEAAGKILAVLIEVNLAAEPAKGGVAPAEVSALVAAVREQPGLRVDGLMAIPPAGSAAESRAHFRRLRALGEENDLRELSMGMTSDFEVAIEEGATMVRVGRAIFGPRR